MGSVGERQEKTPTSNGVENEEEDNFGGFTSIGKKDKGKGKKAVPEAIPEEDAAVIVVPEAEIANGDSWGGWGTAASKKDKKKGKKGVIDEVPVEEPAVVVVPEPETAADDSWGGWGLKKDKKKGKKGEQEPLPPPPPPPPPDSVAAVEEERGTLGTKGKKKGKKGSVEQVSKVEEPVIAFLPEPDEEPNEYPEFEPEAASAVVPEIWGSFGNKKDKKKGKKGAMEEITKVEDPVAVVVPEVVPEPATTAADDTRGSFTTKKDKKKGKKGAAEEIIKVEEPLVVTVPEPETAAPAADDSWASFGSKKDKKKGKKGAIEEITKVEDPPVVVVVPESAPVVMDDEWGAFGTKKEKKKGKNGAFEGYKEVEDPGIVDVPDQESAIDIGWGGASKNDKKSKKKGATEVVDVPITVHEPDPAVEEVSIVADDDWMNWGTGKKKDKKGKKGAVAEPKADEPLPPPPPPPPAVPSPLEDSKNEDWGSFGTSKQNKDKKGKKGKVSEPMPVVPAPEPLMAVVDEPDVTGVEDSWGTWGLSSKDKKKKEKEKAKRFGQDTSIEVVEDLTAMPGTLPDAIVDLDAPAETDTWGTWGTGSKKDKTKLGKRDHMIEAPPPAPTPPAQGLTPEPTSPPFPALDDPEEGEWGSFAPVKTKGKKDLKKDPLSRTTSTAKGAKIEDSKSNKKGAKEPVDDFSDGLYDVDEDEAATEVKKESPKEETPAKAVKGFWGSFGSTATSKTKTAKEKEKDKAKEKDEEKSKVQAQEEIKSEPILEVVDRTDKKGLKNKKDGKLGKVESKGSDKSGKVDDPKSDDIDALIDLMDGTPEFNEDELAELADSFDKKDDKKSDAWSFWGSSKKPTGKKGDEPKKEIGKQASTNQKASLGKPPNEPEPPVADEALPPPPPATAMNKSISAKSKVAGKLSVSEKIKALEKEKEKKSEPVPPPPPPPPPPEPEAPPKADTPPKKSSTFPKAKPIAASKGAGASKKKDISPEPASDKASKESVPGSFPSEGADDDIVDVIDLGPIDKKVNKKAKKGAEKAKMDTMIVDVPAPPSPQTPPAPPTPPPEPTAAKPVKKERARVVRGEGASSWGFWGAAPKKEVKKEKAVKDDVDGVSPPAKSKASPPAMVRSKSTKIVTGKETEKSSSKSSGSDKATKPEARPSKSRGMSFSQLLMGGPSPARTKSTRRSSNPVPKTSSRRPSTDVGAIGLNSPPPDEQPEVSAKAAKVMGMRAGKMDRRPSTKGKQKASGNGPGWREYQLTGSANLAIGVVPDPYAIDDDDDDLIMVNGDDDALVDVPPLKGSSSKKKGPESRAKKPVGPVPSDEHSPPPPAPTAGLPERSGQTRDYFEPLKANGKSKLKQFGGATTATDDIVMVEAGPSNDGPEVTTGSDDLAFVLPPREPAPLKRSMTSAKRPEKLMGLFGSFRKSRRASETFEHPKSKAVYGDDDTRRLRREDRKVRRSGRDDEDDAENVYANVRASGGASTEPEEQGARKDDRRSTRVSRDSPTKKTKEVEARAADERRASRREAEKAEEERRRAKAHEAREKRVREEEEDEARRREEKRARRAAREDRYGGKVLANGEAGIRDGENRRRHRDKGLSSGAPSPIVDERSPRLRRTELRRSHTDKPVTRYDADEEADRRVRHEARRAREDLHRRKSAPPVEDYFDPRNGSRGVRPNSAVLDAPVYNAPPPLPTDADPYLNGANDHTSSWVNSQIIEPPAPPPVEPTVIEPPPTGSGSKHEEQDDDRDVRRDVRKAHRHSKYASVTPDRGDDRRRRRDSRRTERDGIRSSEGSEGDRYTRRKSDYAGYENGGPVRTFDGRLASAGAAKRGSWFKKFANL